MKKIIFYLAVCAAAAACTKQNSNLLPSADTESPEKTVLEVFVPQAETKMADIGQDDKVNTLQIFVFNQDGSLDNYKAVSGTANVTVSCTKGPKKIYAYVNAPSLVSWSHESNLLNASSNVLDNDKENLVMTGKTEVEIDGTQGPVSVTVTRLAARICLKSFTNNIDIPQFKDKKFTVKAIYILNAIGECRYFNPVQNNLLWYNMKTCMSHGNVLYEKIQDEVLGTGGSLSSSHYFYCYPNDTSTDTSDPNNNKPRYTRLVVETAIGDETFYYPVSIPQVAGNTTYDITLSVTRPGSVSPDIPVEKQDADFAVSVAPWGANEKIDQVI